MQGGGRFNALRLPDTVMIRHGVVYRWYFTSSKGGVVMVSAVTDMKFCACSLANTYFAWFSYHSGKIVRTYCQKTSFNGCVTQDGGTSQGLSRST